MKNELIVQYENVIKHGGLFDFSYRGKIEVTGKDRVSFLHRMLTNDIQSLAPGQGCYACFLTAQAKVITDMNVLIFENHVLISVEAGFAPKIIERLNKFVVMDDVNFLDQTNELAAFAIFGNKAEIALASLFPIILLPNRHFSHGPAHLNAVSIEIVRVPFYGTKGWVLLVPSAQKETMWTLLIEAGKKHSIAPIDTETKEILRIEEGIPACGIDFTEENLLLETGLESRAVSFTKGCYPGQEIVARMDSRWKFAKKLVRLVLESDSIPKPGDLIEKDGKGIGKITSAAFSPKLKKPIALGFIARDYFQNDQEVEMVSSAQKVKAHLLL